MGIQEDGLGLGAGVTCVAGLATLHGVTDARYLATSLGYPRPLPAAYQSVWGYSLINLTGGFLVAAAATGQLRSRVFRLRPIVYLGRISYGVYVYHFPLLYLFASFLVAHLDTPAVKWLFSLSVPLRVALMTAIPFAFTVLVAGLSFHLVEDKINQYKHRFRVLDLSSAHRFSGPRRGLARAWQGILPGGP